MSKRNYHGEVIRNNEENLLIPPRWLHCPRKGHPIANKFIPFKTPLSKKYDDQVPEECRFPPSMFTSSLSSYKIKIGLWIDLTNTKRFYNSHDIEEMGIHYVKLQCKGRSECPSEDQTRSFISICQNFISKNPLLYVGVHCTHGFNRTGYLISAYLVESLSWSIDAAVNTFSKCRQPGIYKQEYLDELFRLYGDIDDVISAPDLPDWCIEADDSNRDDDGASLDTDLESRRGRKEFNKRNPTFMVNNENVLPITMQPKLTQIQRKVQKMCGWKSSGFPGSQPVSMTRANLANVANRPYKVSWKADGTRYMMLIDGHNEIYFIDRDNAVFQVRGLTFPHRKDPDKHISNTLVDGEMIIDKVNGSDMLRYLIYDIIKYEGQDVGGTDFNRRLLCINKELIGPRRAAMENGRIDRLSEPFSVRPKEFWEVSSSKTLLSPSFTQKLAHEIDGLIFQPAQDPYKSGQSDCVFKWKPASMNSIDFKLQIIRENRPGMLPQTKGYLFVGGMEQPFADIKVNKELRGYDKKIIECKWEDNQWKFMRERNDKSFPNSYKTAIAVLESIQNPVTEAILFDAINQFYESEKQRKHSSHSYAPSSSSSQHNFYR